MYFEIVSQFLDVLPRIFSSFFCLRFTLGSPSWPFFKVTDSFLGQVTTPEDPIKDIFHSYCSSMNSGIPFLFSFTVSIYLPPLRCRLFPLEILAYLSQLSYLPCLITPAAVSYLNWICIASTVCSFWNSDDSNVSPLAFVPQLPNSLSTFVCLLYHFP